MPLSDYTFEEIEAEYILRKKQRQAERLAERATVKRCRNCVLYGTVTAFGKERDVSIPLQPWQSGYCPHVLMKRPLAGRTHRAVPPSNKACEHFKPQNN